MAKILCIGDLHYKADNWLESEQLNTFLLESVKIHKPDLIVVLGDVLHNHRKIDSSLLALAVNFIAELSLHCPVRVIIGNHDRINNTEFLTPIHPFVGIKPTSNLAYVWKVEEYRLGDFRFALVPYVYPGRFMEALQTKFTLDEIKDLDIVFAHQEIRGVKENSIVSKKGDVWPGDFPLLISGHIHQYQRLGDNVVYVGTPRMVDFGDSIDKTISLFTNKDGWNEERIDVPLAKKTTIKVTFQDIVDGVVKWDVKPDRIQVEGTKTELLSLRNNLTVDKWKKDGIKIQPLTIKDDKKIDYIKPSLTFLDQLKESIADNEDLKSILDEILIGC